MKICQIFQSKSIVENLNDDPTAIYSIQISAIEYKNKSNYRED